MITALGMALVGLAVVDLLSTTLSVAGASGFVSMRVADLVWHQVLRLRLSHRWLQLVGPAIVSGMVAAWVLLLWAGWTLVFVGAGDAVVATDGGTPASTGQRVFFAGYLVATLGNGDYTAVGTGWQITSVLASLCGLMTATLAITFLVPVVSGVAHRRQVAASIASLGDTPARILQRSFDGEGFSPLTTHLANLLPELTLLTQRHLAYPVLHYFHSDQRHSAVAPMIAVLDETLAVLQHGVATRGLDNLTLTSARDAVAELLRLLERAYISPAAEAPPPPALDVVPRSGPALTDQASFVALIDSESPRRRLLRGFLEADGWSWDEVNEAPVTTSGV